MDRTTLLIVGMVFVVGIVGYLTIMPPVEPGDALTGNVIAGDDVAEDVCGSCYGDPVCAGKNAKAFNYPNACAAQCDNARVLYEGLCEEIPKATQ